MSAVRAVALVCALLALAGCASLPELRNVAIEADVSTQVAGDFQYRWADTDYHGGHLARVAVVLEQPVTSSFSYRIGLQHTSLLDTRRDRGEERAAIGIAWHPFAAGAQ